MGWTEFNREPSARELRFFGGLLAAVLGLVGCLLWWRTQSLHVAWVLWGVGLVLAMVYYAVPTLRWPLYMLVMIAVYPLGWLLSHLFLAVIFYGLISTFGLVMRLFGRDWVKRRFDPRSRSYWIRLRTEKETSRYLRQF